MGSAVPPWWRRRLPPGSVGRIVRWDGWGRVGRGVAGVAAVAVAVAAVAGVWFTGQSLLATRDQYRLSEQGQVTERFSHAIDNLGSDKLDVRVGGIYLLERLSAGSPADHATVVDIVSAFVRTHSPVSVCPAAGTVIDAHNPDNRLPTDVQAALTVIARRDITGEDGRQIDLLRTCLAGARLNDAKLANVNISGGDVRGAQFSGADMEVAALVNIEAAGAELDNANLSGALFTHASLTDTNFSHADLSHAVLQRANLARANLGNANLSGAFLDGVNMAGASLADADLSGTKLDTVTLDGIFYTPKTVWPKGFTPPPSRASFR
ncbi:pentapeptide repeat-containing protein [Nocardia sp. NPDC058058]|uniref:pentapeptide repeat-containing protein n=1 Tax=Nocardia sp. NPDC058058 TaxID=3346317 RepID=UPI0036DCCFCB